MKYRMLTQEELQVFEEELKQFLIVNGVHGEEWEQMNQENVAQATQLVEMFSDTVLQKVYEKIMFIEHRTSTSCMVFKLNDDQIDLISINLKEGATVDLSTPEGIHEALSKHANQLTFFKTTKKYNKERELEIHELLEHGCVHSDQSFWALLNKVIED